MLWCGKKQFGSFDVPSSGTLASVKLVHVDGYVRCNRDNWSFWGCGQNPELDVNVEIKDGDTAILPSRVFLIRERGGGGGGGGRSLCGSLVTTRFLQSWCCRPTSPILQT